MSAYWYDQRAYIYDPSDLTVSKVGSEGGRTIEYLQFIKAEGEWEKNGIGSGSAVLHIADRDANPLVGKGDIVWCQVKADPGLPTVYTVACFIVDKFNTKENDDGSGELTVSGPGIAKELQRKLAKFKYVSGEVTGLARVVDASFVDLEDGHGGTADMYAGNFIEVQGNEAEIETYNQTIARAYLVEDSWSPAVPDPGGDLNYIIYHGPSLVDIDKALEPVDDFGQLPEWSSVDSGTNEGTQFTATGKTSWDMMLEISQQSGQFFYFTSQAAPNKEIYFEPGAPVSSGLRAYKYNYWTYDQFKNNKDRSPLIDVEREIEFRDDYTRLYGFGNDVTLGDLPVAEIVVPTGFSINVGANLITHVDGEAGLALSEIVEKRLNYDIAPVNESDQAKGDAAIQLRDAMVTDLLMRDPRAQIFKFTTVVEVTAECTETIEFGFERYGPNNELIWKHYGDVYINKLKHYCGDDTKGMRYTDFECSDKLAYHELDGESHVAELLKRADSGGTIIYQGGTGGGGGYTAGVGILIDGLNVISFNAAPVAGTHLLAQSTHVLAVDAWWDGQAYPGHVMSSDANGEARFTGLGLGTTVPGSGDPDVLRLGGNLRFVGSGHSILSTSILNITPQTLVVEPLDGYFTASDIYFNDDHKLFGSGYISLEPVGALYLDPGNGVAYVDGDILFTGSARQVRTLVGDLTIGANVNLMFSPLGFSEFTTVTYMNQALIWRGLASIETITGNINIMPHGGTAGDIFLNGRVVVGSGKNMYFTNGGDIGTEGPGDLSLVPEGAFWANPTSNFSAYPGGYIDFAPVGLQLYLKGHLTFYTGDWSITTYGASDNITLRPLGELYAGAGEDNFWLEQGTIFKGVGFIAGNEYAIGTSFAIEQATGKGYFHSLYSDILHVTLFQADVSVAKNGSIVVVPSVAELARDLVVVAPAVFANLYVKDNPAAPDVPVFQDGDYVRIRYTRQDQGLHIDDVWGTVSGYTDMEGLDDGQQRWYYLITYAGDTDILVGETVPAGVPALGYGQQGDGMWSVSVLDNDGLPSQTNAPYTRIATWHGTTPYDPGSLRLHMQTGQLNLVTGQNEWGMWAGKSLDTGVGIQDDDQYFVISDQRVRLNNLPIQGYDYTEQVYEINPQTDYARIVIGKPMLTTPHQQVDNTQKGVWLGLWGSEPFARIGSGLGPAMYYSGSSGNLVFYNSLGNPVIQFQNDGSTYFAGPMVFGPAGSIEVGYLFIDQYGMHFNTEFGSGASPPWGGYTDFGSSAIKYMFGTEVIGSMVAEAGEPGGQIFKVTAHARNSNPVVTWLDIYSRTRGSQYAGLSIRTLQGDDSESKFYFFSQYTDDLMIYRSSIRLGPDLTDPPTRTIAFYARGAQKIVTETPTNGVYLYTYNGELYYKDSVGNTYKVDATLVP